jgi:hypothetical protein
MYFLFAYPVNKLSFTNFLKSLMSILNYYILFISSFHSILKKFLVREPSNTFTLLS